MIPGKSFLVAYGAVEVALFAAATATDASTYTLAAIGLASGLGLIGKAAIDVYAAWRKAKHDADNDDGTLVQVKLDEALARIDDLEHQVIAWKSLAKAQGTTSKDMPVQTPGQPPPQPPKAA